MNTMCCVSASLLKQKEPTDRPKIKEHNFHAFLLAVFTALAQTHTNSIYAVWKIYAHNVHSRINETEYYIFVIISVYSSATII